jgi:hypothetical protein
MQDLARAQTRIVGLVVNKVRSRRAAYYGNYDYSSKEKLQDGSRRLTKPKQAA